MEVLLETDLLSIVTPKLANFNIYKRFADDNDMGFAPASWDAPTGEDDYQEVGDHEICCQLVLSHL